MYGLGSVKDYHESDMIETQAILATIAMLKGKEKQDKHEFWGRLFGSKKWQKKQ